jgi:adhesin transport system membrane fusion protein
VNPSLATIFANMESLQMVQSPPGYMKLGRVLGAMCLVIAICLGALPWQQTAPGAGRVISYSPVERQQIIEAPIEARVRRWHVREGSRVVKGTVLVELNDVDPQLQNRLTGERLALQGRLAGLKDRVQALDKRLDAVTNAGRHLVNSATARVNVAKQRADAARQSITAADATLLAARLQIERQQALVTQGLSSTRQVELARMEYVRAETEQARARIMLSAAQGELGSAQADLSRARSDAEALIADVRGLASLAQADLAPVQAELLRLETRVARQSTQVVRAPRAGTIQRLDANLESALVRAGDPLALLVPDHAQRAVELYVTGNDTPLLSVGQSVRLQFEGWPALQFSGWPSVAVGTFGGRIALIDPSDNGDGKFRIIVTPDGIQPWPVERFLRQGVRAKGWVLLSQVSLAYELWRQFNGFPPALMLDDTPKLEDGTKANAPAKRLK